MKGLTTFTPQNFYLIVQPDRLYLYRFGNAVFRQDKFKSQQEFPLPTDGALGPALRQIRQEYTSKNDDSWFLGLPLRYFTLVNFTLPKAASENLEQAVHYSLMRHVPYDLSLALTHFRSEEKGDLLDIAATIAPKAQIRPLLEEITSAGITLAAIFPALTFWTSLMDRDGIYVNGGKRHTEVMVWSGNRTLFHAWDSGEDEGRGEAFLSRTRTLMGNLPQLPAHLFAWKSDIAKVDLATLLGREEQDTEVIEAFPAQTSRDFQAQPYQISLVPASKIRQRKMAFWVQMIAASILILAILSYPLAHLLGKRTHLKILNGHISGISAQADKLSALKRRNDDLVHFFEHTSRQVKSQPHTGDILKEVTEIMPQTTWLNAFTMSGEKIQLQGTTESATAVIEALENSPLFKQARFDSPITNRGKQEIFKIAVTVEG